MTPQQLKEYFDSNPPPLEVQWKPWAKIENTRHFIDACMTGIANYKGHYERCPDYWHLKEFYEDITSGKI